MKISIVIPCYNEELMLPLFFEAVHKTLLLLNGYTYELLFVDDGSTDKTFNLIKEFSSCNTFVKYISFTRNFGKEAAMIAGLKNSTGDIICIIDADLQDPPQLLLEMLHFIEDGFDMVVLRRITRKGESVFKSMFSKLFYRIFNFISADVTLVNGERDFRMITRVALNGILALNEHNRFSKGIFNWAGYNTKWLQYDNVVRAKGDSKWSILKLLEYMSCAVTSFSTFPLRVIISSGILVILIAFVYLIWTIKKIYFNEFLADAFTYLMFTVLFLGGLILLALGIIGEYLSKIYLETKDRPDYLISKTNISHLNIKENEKWHHYDQ